MKLPLAEDFLEIVHHKTSGSLAMLKNYQFLSGDNGKTWNHKSRHAIVFKAEHNLKFYAIRFFLNDDVELFRRYQEVQNQLQNLSLSWIVPFRFLHEEYYPVVKMDWVEGISLAQYIDLIISKPLLINQLQSKLVSLSRSLEENKIGHGNLNLNHIRFEKQGQDYVLKLIDYDSMFVAAFKDLDSLSAGTSSFQHPMRLSSDFSETIDRFSIWVLLTALEAIKVDSLLWLHSEDQGYDKSKQILFNYRDLASPQQSRIFQALPRYENDALNFYADKLVQFCNSKTLDIIETPHLYHSKNSSASKNEVKEIQEAKNNYEQVPKKQTQPMVPVMHRPVLTDHKTILPDNETIIENELVDLKQGGEQRLKKKTVQTKKKKISPLIVLIPIAILIASSLYFFNLKDQPPKTSTNAQTPLKKAVPPVASPIVQKPIVNETVFTQSSLTQFLFGLYQSYNKRAITSILSNYADSLVQYYDANAVTKNKLKTIIKDLFIKPAYYECKPDLRTLQFNVQKDTCKLSVAVTETIKANKRSKSENYSSRIEYMVDTSFKILAERNIE